MHYTILLTIFAVWLFIGFAVSEERYEKCSSSDCTGKVACVTIYQKANFGGWYQCQTVASDSDCVTFNSWWIGQGSRVSSVDTHDTCVRLHEQTNCRGFSADIKPGSMGHRYLSEVGFDEDVKSVSSCNQPMNTGCEIKALFSKLIPTNEVSSASTEILEKLDDVANLAVSGFSAVIPGLDLFYSGLKFVIGLFNSEKSTEALIDAKVESAAARNSASQIAAKIHVIGNRLESLMSPDTPAADRRIDLGLAFHTCEEVKKLFEDSNYSFSRNKVVSSPYLVAFSSVYLSVAKLVYVMRPEMEARVEREINDLVVLNEAYRTEAITQRKAKFTWDYFPNGYIVEDRLVCEAGRIGGGRGEKECYSYRSCQRWSKCQKCLDIVKENIENEVNMFFQPVIRKLKQFPSN